MTKFQIRFALEKKYLELKMLSQLNDSQALNFFLQRFATFLQLPLNFSPTPL